MSRATSILLTALCLLSAGLASGQEQAQAPDQPPPSEASATVTTATESAPAESLPTIPVPQKEEAPPPKTKEADGVKLEEVIVTGGKRAENLQKLAGSVSVVTGKDIEGHNLNHLEDITRSMPNVTMSAENLTGSTNVRGMGTPFQAGADPGVLAVVDDVVIPVAYLAFAYLDLQSIELLRGPQGTLYGRDAEAGVFKVNTNDPTSQYEGHVALKYGSYNNRRIEAVGNIPLGEDAGVRVKYVNEARDGYIYNTARHEDDSATTKSAAGAKFKWNAASDLSFTTNLLYVTLDLPRGFGYQAVACPDYYQTAAQEFDPQFHCQPGYTSSHDLAQTEDAWAYFGSEVVSWKVHDYTLQAFLSYWNVYTFTWYDGDYSPLPLFSLPLLAHEHDLSGELRLLSPDVRVFDRRLSFITGLYYDQFWYSADYALNVGMLPCAGLSIPGGILSLPGITSVVGNNSVTCSNDPHDPPTVESIGFVQRKRVYEGGVFAQATYDLLDSLDVTLGLRYTRVQTNMDRLGNTATCFGAQAQCALALAGDYGNREIDGLKRVDPHWAPKAALRWSPTRTMMLYGSLGTGFKPGAYSQQVTSTKPASTPVSPDPVSTPVASTFEPERSLSFELGWKNTLFHGMTKINVAAFFTRYRDFQIVVVDSLAQSHIGNAKEAQSKGVELESRTFLPGNLMLTLNGGFLDGKYTDYTNAVQTNGGCPAGQPNMTGSTATCNLNGVQLMFAPRWKSSILLDGGWGIFDWPVKLIAGIDATYTSRTLFQSSGDPKASQGPFWLFNARTGFASVDGKWSATFFVDNVLNKLNYQIVSPIPVVSDAYWASVNPPREFWGQVAWHF
ncbi:MAG TPA: TonB-dependent receptor [Nevskiaceae bacterium]|nr:TonB-dependent receptor [Nevskiaceae bacterium]